MKKYKIGVSLAELLAVVVIMGIIAAIAVPLVGRLIEDTKKDALLGDAVTVAESIRIYCLTNEDAVGCNGSNNQTINLLLSSDGSYSSSNLTWHTSTADKYSTASGIFSTTVSKEIAANISKTFPVDEYVHAYATVNYNNNGEVFLRIRTKDNYQFTGFPLTNSDHYISDTCLNLVDKSISFDGNTHTAECLTKTGSPDTNIK